jgi:hypothetical protein
MNVPGFSAEASLPYTNDSHRASKSIDQGGGKVYPAQRIPLLSDTVTVEPPFGDVKVDRPWWWSDRVTVKSPLSCIGVECFRICDPVHTDVCARICVPKWYC